MELKRSWMFVPGHRQKMIDKALGLNADAIMLDIEDGVAPNEKDNARQLIGEALGHEKAPHSPARFVRINAIGHARMDADLEAVVRPGLEGLVCPKVEAADEVRKVDAILTDREPKQKMARGGVKLLIAIESPRGLLNAPAIAACSPRVCGLMFGAEDFGRELGDVRKPVQRRGALEPVGDDEQVVDAAGSRERRRRALERGHRVPRLHQEDGAEELLFGRLGHRPLSSSPA